MAQQYGARVAGTEQAKDLVRQMAHALGVGAGAVAGTPGQADPKDPRQAEIDALNQRLSAFERQQQDTLREKVSTALSVAETRLKAFTEAKDAEGKPAHPHFDRVRRQMALAVQTANAAGETLSLEDAYDRAVWADPELRQQLTAAQTRAEATKAAQARRDHAARAGRARTPDTASVSGAAPVEQDLRDDLRDAFRDSMARARS